MRQAVTMKMSLFPLSLSMVEGEGGASGGGRGGGEFGRFISAAMILVWRASGESSESK